MIASSVVTMIYSIKNWLKLLYEAHLKYPKAVITNQWIISYDDAQHILPYTQWRTLRCEYTIRRIVPIGSSGTLYPPSSLYTSFKRGLFKALPKGR